MEGAGAERGKGLLHRTSWKGAAGNRTVSGSCKHWRQRGPGPAWHFFQSNLTDGTPDSPLEGVINMSDRGGAAARWSGVRSLRALHSCPHPRKRLGLWSPRPPLVPPPTRGPFSGGGCARLWQHRFARWSSGGRAWAACVLGSSKLENGFVPSFVSTWEKVLGSFPTLLFRPQRGSRGGPRSRVYSSSVHRDSFLGGCFGEVWGHLVSPA